MSQKKNAFEKALTEAVDEGLLMLGESGRDIVYFRLQRYYALKKEDIPSSPKIFVRCLREVFGSGAEVNYAESRESVEFALDRLMGGLSYEHRGTPRIYHFIDNEERKISRKALLVAAIGVGAVVVYGLHHLFNIFLPQRTDSDRDGLTDFDEKNVYHTNHLVADTDGDGLIDGFEVAHDLNPLRKNPSVSYALSKGIPLENALKLKVLDEDEVMDTNEKGFIDYCVFIVESLIPEEVRNYYLDEEILGYRRTLIESILPDGISDSELKAIDGLRTNFANRWYVQRDIICSGMVSDKNLSEDWDEDSTNGKHLSNLDEILQGTNPLNDLETNPNNLSERYAILVNSAAIAGHADLNLEIYHLLKRNGYIDRNIELFYSLLPMHKDTFDILARQSNFSWLHKKHSLEDFTVEIDYEGYDNITPSNFLSAIKNLPSDKNDTIFIYYLGHGPGPLGGLGPVYHSEMNKALKSIKYGKCIFLNETCAAEWYVKRLGQPYSPNDLLTIGSTSENETAGSDFSDHFFIKINEGKSIKEAFDYASEEVSHHPVIYYYGPNKECPWIDNFNIVVYIKK